MTAPNPNDRVDAVLMRRALLANRPGAYGSGGALEFGDFAGLRAAMDRRGDRPAGQPAAENAGNPTRSPAPQPTSAGGAHVFTSQPTAALVAQIGSVMATHAQRLADQRPWGAENPVVWALKSGRIANASAPGWLERYIADPATTGPLLAVLEPVLDGRLKALEAQMGIDGAGSDEDAELAEFDALFPPHMRSGAGRAAVEVDREGGEDFTEFDALFRPGYRH